MNVTKFRRRPSYYLQFTFAHESRVVPQKYCHRIWGQRTWRFDDSFGASTLADYLFYASATCHSSPLGIYDSQFGEKHDPRCILLQKYDVPAIFEEDLFAFCDHSVRPPFRWVLIGTKGSGTPLHVDPVYTSAWVTLMEGMKRWVMIKPQGRAKSNSSFGGLTPAKPKECASNLSAWEFFAQYHPTLASSKQQCWSHEDAVEILQRPGETVFVPAGWRHCVVNLTDTVAVTHNYAADATFEKTWQDVAEREPRFASKWYDALKENAGEYADRILEFL